MSSLKNASVLTIGQLGSYGCSFARNMILARILTKADFGLVSVFAMTISLLELTSRMSLGTQIIQSRHGENENFQKTFHIVLAGIGIASAILIASCAIPFSRMFGVPQAAWAFALLSVAPLLKGIEHLDNYRQRRNFNFTPGVLSELIPQIIVTLAAWPLAIWLKDYRVIIWIIISKAGLTVLLTHLFAERKYGWAIEREFIGSMIAFSWPLLLNGLLIFFSQQADQFLIGTFLSLEDVALYAAAFSFAILPFFILAPIQSNLFLPRLSRLQDNTSAFERSYQNCLQTSAIIAVITLSPIISSGEDIAVLFYGPKYQNTGILVAILGAACAFRCFRVAPAIAAIARADTINQLYSNIVRASSIGLALLAVMAKANLATIAACTLVGEVTATSYSIYRLKKSQRISIKTSINPIIILITALALSTIPAIYHEYLSTSLSISASILIFLLEVTLARWLFPIPFNQLTQIIFKNNKKDLKQ